MLRFRDATPEDIHTVFSDLSEISRAEVIAGSGSWWAAIPKMLTLLTIQGARTEALVDESGTPLAIFGHYGGAQPKTRTTLFVFTDGFLARGVAATLASRRRLLALQFFYPGIRFHSFTGSPHPDRDRWFALLGFRRIGRRDDKHHYILPESDKISDLQRAGQYSSRDPRAS